MFRLLHRRALSLLTCLAALSAPGAAPLDGRFLRDFAETRGFRHGRPAALQLGPRGEVIYFLRSGPRSRSQGLFVYEVATGRTRELVTPAALAGADGDKLSPAEAARRERLRLSAAGLTSYELGPGGREILVPYGDGLFLVDAVTGAARRLPLGGGAFDPKLSPDGRDVGFIRDHDVWALNLATGRERQVTRGGTAEVSHGEAEFVAAEEMGRHTGWWWAPDGKSILYQESDARGVELWHVADPARPEIAPRAPYCPRPGQANVRVRLGLVGVRGGRTTWLKWDAERFPYLAHADWHPAGGLTVKVQSRDQRELVLLRADPRTGTTTPLLTERDEDWVNLAPRLPAWLADGSGFLWASERAGAWQLELRGADGALRRVLAPPEAGFREFVALDSARREVFFTAGTHPARSAVFRVPLEGGSARALADEPGLNSAILAAGAEVWVHGFAGPQTMPRSFVRARDGRVLGELPSVAEEPALQPRAEILRVGDGEFEML
ncbi:MAG TPA: DPP IV N-terminal domain-containing protein, partial [Verrucomicrobiota bacterium]|nr:DPP IV N-terminal domain-containing protein [Verrucomicrobiota bacterium]